MTWDPKQYERFRDERSQPFYDLLALIVPRPGMRAVDLGCGTGSLTRVLHERLACAETVGYDSSPAMLDAARAPGAPPPGLRFEHADIAELAPARSSLDLVLASASLHWLPDHPALLARLVEWLAPAGQLAVQVPANFDYPTHTLAHELAATRRWAGALGGFLPQNHVLDPAAYSTILHRTGLRPTRTRLEVYGHLLASAADVVEWVRGTTLTAFKARLSEGEYASFEDEYRAELLRRLPADRPFFYPFKRILLWGARA